MLSTTVRTPARLVLPIVLLSAAAPLSAQEPTQVARTGEQREHVVRRGDTLWDLARLYLGNPFLWPSIYEANRTVVEDPHWIYPLERLLIPPVAARDAVEHVGEPRPPADAQVPPVAPPVQPPVDPVEEAPPQVVAAMVDLRQPIVPLSEYLAAPWVSTRIDADIVGRIVAPRDPAARTSRLPTMLHTNDVVHVGNLRGTAPAVDDSLLIVRLGPQIPGRGRVVEPLGILRVATVDDGVLTARLARHFGEAHVGDAVIPMETVPAIAAGTPEPVFDGPQGRLLQFLRDEPLYGTTDLAFISLGAADGVGIGDEVTVYVPGRNAPAGAELLPTAAVATLRIVKVADNTSTARVLTVNSTSLRDGLPIRVTRRMQ